MTVLQHGLSYRERLRGRLHPDAIGLIRRALQIDPKKRYATAAQMLAAFRGSKSKATRFQASRSPSKTRAPARRQQRDWETVRCAPKGDVATT